MDGNCQQLNKHNHNFINESELSETQKQYICTAQHAMPITLYSRQRLTQQQQQQQ